MQLPVHSPDFPTPQTAFERVGLAGVGLREHMAVLSAGRYRLLKGRRGCKTSETLMGHQKSHWQLNLKMPTQRG